MGLTDTVSQANTRYSGPNEQEVRQQLDRILKSELFAKSPQLSRFLKHCVEQTLAGRQDHLKEQLLGTEVFRRAPFDARLDPIVRVEARRLRSKLDEYYAAEGAADPIVISFLRGHYIPRFVPVGRNATRPDKPPTILIVEADGAPAKDVETRLRSFGYNVLGIVATAEGALQAAHDLRPDLVLIDVTLSVPMQGVDAGRRVWERWRIPVVYLTAFTDASLLEDIKRSEPYGCVLRPFQPKQLHTVLQLALSRRAREVAAHGEDARSRALNEALEHADIRTWEWVVHDETLSWPDSVAPPLRPVLVTGNTPAPEFRDQIRVSDRQRVETAFTSAIRERGRIQVAYGKNLLQPDPVEAISIGFVSVDSAGAVHCRGLEIGSSAHHRSHSSITASQLRDLQENLRSLKSYAQSLTRQHDRAESIPDSPVTQIEHDVDRMQALVSDMIANATGNESR